MSAMWTSKLGNKYPRELIDRLDAEHHRLMQHLRKMPRNACCAECGEDGTTWSSVNLGIFLCIRCADVHRALGTHISKVKGCSGTYLWGPDEIIRMQEGGNAHALVEFGGDCRGAKPARDASKYERVELCRKKYEQRLWAPPAVNSHESKASTAPASTPAPVTSVAAQAGTCEPIAKDVSEVAAEASWFDDLFNEFNVLATAQDPLSASKVDAILPDLWSAAIATGVPMDGCHQHVHCRSIDTAAVASNDMAWPSSTAATGKVASGFSSDLLSMWPDTVLTTTAPAKALPQQDTCNLWDDFGAW